MGINSVYYVDSGVHTQVVRLGAVVISPASLITLIREGKNRFFLNVILLDQ